MLKCKAVVLAAYAILLTGAHDPATAQEERYPAKPIRMIVPFAPGGGTDIMARLVAQKTAEQIGQTVIVDNRAGGGGSVGAEMAARATPDGYTIIMVSGSYGTNAAVYKLPYDPVNDIQPIVMIGESGFVITVLPARSYRSMGDLVAYAKSNPGKLNYASTGTGGITHLASELLNLLAGIRTTHIPYKGTGPALNDLLGGQVDFLVTAMPAAIPHLRSGRLRGIGVTTAQRATALPDIPPIGDTVKGYDVVLWYGLWGPKGMPRDIVDRWNREVARALQTDVMKKRLAGDGVEPAGGPPEQFKQAISRDIAKWKKVVKAANIQSGR
jgi:tripartite-type tricarboxylate transporter receptor subunit TctC